MNYRLDEDIIIIDKMTPTRANTSLRGSLLSQLQDKEKLQNQKIAAQAACK